MANKTPISAPELKELRAHNKSYWKDRIALDEKMSKLYYGDNEIGVEDTTDPKRTFKVTPQKMRGRMLTWVVNRARAFYPVLPQFTVQSALGPTAQKAAENVSNFLNEAPDRVMDESGEQTWQLVVADSLLLARGADIVLPGHASWNSSDFPLISEGQSLQAWKKANERWRKGRAVPITWDWLPAGTTFPPTVSMAKEMSLSEFGLTGWELRQQFGELVKGRLGNDPKKLSRKHTLLMHVDLCYITYALAEGGKDVEFLRQVEHGMDEFPVRYSPAILTNDLRPDRHWSCPAQAVADLAQTLDERLTEWATRAHLNSMGPYKFKLSFRGEGDDGAKTRVREFFIQDAIVLDADEDEDVNPLPTPDVGTDLPALTDMLVEMIQRVTGLSSVLAGQGIGRETPAWSIRLAADLASEMNEPISVNLAKHGKSVASRYLSAVRGFDEEIILSARKEGAKSISLKPKQAKEWKVLVTAAMQPRFLMTRNADLALLSQLNANEDMPWRWLVENLAREDNPEELRSEKIVDRALKNPIVDEALTRQALKEAQIILDDDEAEGVEELLPKLGEQSPEMRRLLQRLGALPPEATSQSLRKRGQPTNTIPGPQPTAAIPGGSSG